MVDSLPFLRYVPEWLPGAGWKRSAREWKKLVTRLANAPFEHVKQTMAGPGGYQPSIVSQLLVDYPTPDNAIAIRNVGAIIYAAGADTTAAILHIFTLAMVLHPGAQRAAQVELDALGRLPKLEDRPCLPYVNALLKEVLRWHPFQGYRIPKGASLHSNNWVMFRDPRVYGEDAHMFRPERFLVPDPPRDASAVFGLGRRACPGRFFADNMIFITAACILAVFDILPPADGSAVEARFKSGFFSPPKPFKCQIKARSKRALQLIMETAAAVEKEGAM